MTNLPAGVHSRPLPELFHRLVENAAATGPVYPCPGLIRQASGLVLFLGVSRATVGDAIGHLVRSTAEDGPTAEFLFGVDGDARPGDGTELPHVVSLCHWRREHRLWRFGVIEYQAAPRQVKPIDWHNERWSAVVRASLEGVAAVIGVDISPKASLRLDAGDMVAGHG